MRSALRAEYTKLRTAPGTWWLLLGTVVLTIGLSALASATAGCPEAGCTVDPTRTSLTGIQLGQALVAVLAVLMVGGEYGTGMMGVTLAAMPRRSTVLAAKAAVLTGVVTAAATPTVLACVVLGRLLAPAAPSTVDSTVLRAALGSVLYVALIALLALGTATAVRDSATGIGIMLGLLYVVPILIQLASDRHLRRHLQQLTPVTAGLAIQATRDLHSLPVGPWTGLGVLAAWTALALITGGLLLRLRDA